MKQRVFSEHLAMPSEQHEQADQFLADTVANKNGLFILPFPTRLLGVYAKSDAGLTVEWTVSIGLPIPGTTNVSYHEIGTGTGRGINRFGFSALPDLPAGSMVRIATNAVVGANLRAQIVTAILQEAL